MKKISNKIFDKTRKYFRRKNRVNKTLKAQSNLPRLIVNRTNCHIYAQVVDLNWNVLSFANDLKLTSWTKKERANQVWNDIAKKLLEKWIDKVVFDRNWYIYHWRVLQLAEGAREWWIKF